MASITNRNGSYRITVTSGTDVDGKKIRETITYKPTAKTPKAIEKEVQRFADEFEERVKNGKYLSGEKMTFAEVVESWKNDSSYTDLTPSGQESYDDQLRLKIMPVIGNMKIAKISPIHIQKIRDNLIQDNYAPKSIRRTFTVMNSVFNYAVSLRITSENPCKAVRLPKNKTDKNLHYFTVDQAQRFMNSLSGEFTVNHPEKIRTNGRIIPAHSEIVTIPFQFQVYFTIAIHSGFRRGEMIALTWEDVDFDNRTISIEKAVARCRKEGAYTKDPKTEAGHRTIKLPSICFDLLKEWKIRQKEESLLLGSDWKGYKRKQFDKNRIFIQKNGLPMDLSTPTHKFKEIIEMYNNSVQNDEDKLPDIRLHDLRHTSATLLLAYGADIETVSNRLGHSKASVTLDVYGHALKSMDSKASDLLESIFYKKQA